jgi:hypothetical protein
MTDKITPLHEEAPPFSMGTVESIDPPAEGAGKYWCKYTIVQGHNTITGYRKGGAEAYVKHIQTLLKK